MALADDFGGTPELLAAFNGEEDFVGLLASSDNGMSVRADNNWHTMSPSNRFFLGATIFPVDEDFLEFFDRLDSKGTEPTLKQVLSFAVEDDDEDEESTPE
jgi:hypothetical protein